VRWVVVAPVLEVLVVVQGGVHSWLGQMAVLIAAMRPAVVSAAVVATATAGG
jgi:hypothetical protein